ncbi:hypothetical protein HJC23_005540 [Cyclotella cryptica]|uniref:Proteasome assembly chaperone 2 n=1 Tax=Cyclotella cryptica TaxID=29204 RepID=A0ABD3Q2V0_9STRA
MPLSIRLILIVVILNDVHLPLVPADGHNPINTKRHCPAFSKRPSASTRSHSPLHVSRGGGQDILPQTQQHPSHTSNHDDDDDYSTPPSPYEYIPVTALDDYGQSIQLRHAMQAAQRYGTPVIACLCRVDHNQNHDDDDHVDHTNESSPVENAILVCSLQRPHRGIIAPTPDISSGILRTATTREGHHVVHPSIRGMVHIVTTRDDVSSPHPSVNDNPSSSNTNTTPWPPRHALHTALVVTGLQSDAYFLLHTLRKYCISKYWFRYDTLPPSSSSGMVRLVREILLDFQGYDWNREVGSTVVSGGIGGASPRNSGEEDDTDDDDGAMRAGRPLGLCTLLLGLDPESTTTTKQQKGEGRPSLTVVRANGSSEGYVAYAMGVGSEGGNERLSRLWRRGMTAEEAKAMMREILREIAVEKGWLDDEKNGLGRNRLEDEMVESHRVNEVDGRLEGSSIASEFTIVCETVTTRGIDIEYLNL